MAAAQQAARHRKRAGAPTGDVEVPHQHLLTLGNPHPAREVHSILTATVLFL